MEGEIDPDFEEPKSVKKIRKRASKGSKRIHLRNLGNVLDRTEISDRKAALLTSMILHDASNNSSEIFRTTFDRNMIRRLRKSNREKAIGQKNMLPICGLYFYERKDKTLKIDEVDGVK